MAFSKRIRSWFNQVGPSDRFKDFDVPTQQTFEAAVGTMASKLEDPALVATPNDSVATNDPGLGFLYSGTSVDPDNIIVAPVVSDLVSTVPDHTFTVRKFPKLIVPSQLLDGLNNIKVFLTAYIDAAILTIQNQLDIFPTGDAIGTVKMYYPKDQAMMNQHFAPISGIGINEYDKWQIMKGLPGGAPWNDIIPDMSARFAMGETTQTVPIATPTGGTDVINLTDIQLPPHTHDVGTITTSPEDLDHVHTLIINNSSDHTHGTKQFGTHNNDWDWANITTPEECNVLFTQESTPTGGAAALDSGELDLIGYNLPASGIHTHTGSAIAVGDPALTAHTHVLAGDTDNGPGSSQDINIVPQFQKIFYILKYK